MENDEMKVAQFLALLFTALALVPAGAHLFSLPNKIHLAQTDYFIAQSIYRGWALFGIVLFGAVLANLALAIVVRAQTAPFVLALASLFCQVATLALFFAFVYPTNVATHNWTVVPANWEVLRRQWEVGHAINALIVFAGFCALTLSVLTTRE
jgi:hypothetical protein